MWNARAGSDSDGIISLVKQTAEGLSELIADHIKLARVEIAADAKAYGRKVALLTVAGVFLVIGYVFAWIAAAFLLARWLGAPLAFLLIGIAHLGGGAIGLRLVRGKLKNSHMLDDTVAEVSRSVATLSAQVSGSGGAPEARVPPTP